MARLSQSRIARVEHFQPHEPPHFVIEEMFVEGVDGRPGRSYLGVRIETLPRAHPYASVEVHFAEYSELAKRRIWNGRRGGPWYVAEVFDPPALLTDLPGFDINAAIRWRVTCPREWDQWWGKEPTDRWIRTLVRLAESAPTPPSAPIE